MNTKLQAIAHLEKAFNDNPKYKKDWKDYIELCIIDELEKNKIKLPITKESKFVKDCSEHILRTLFQADWWAAQGLK